MGLMEWAAVLGNFGEFVGALAVVATLAYLVVQVRQNTVAVRQQTYSDLTSRRQAWFLSLGDNQDKADVFMRGLDNDLTNMTEANQFALNLMSQMFHYQDCMLQHRAGIIEGDLWQAEKNLLGSIVGDPGFVAMWPTMQSFFIPDFVAEVSNLEHSGSHMGFDPTTGNWHTTDEVPRDRDDQQT